MLKVANLMAVTGLGLLALAMTAVTYLITDVLYENTSAAVVAGLLAGAFVIVWFLLPLVYGQDRTPPAGHT